MGEKLELKLKSPVGAEAAGYPWPLPVYVSNIFIPIIKYRDRQLICLQYGNIPTCFIAQLGRVLATCCKFLGYLLNGR